METTIKNTKLYFKDTTGYECNHDIHGIKKKKKFRDSHDTSLGAEHKQGWIYST